MLLCVTVKMTWDELAEMRRHDKALARIRGKNEIGWLSWDTWKYNEIMAIPSDFRFRGTAFTIMNPVKDVFYSVSIEMVGY